MVEFSRKDLRVDSDEEGRFTTAQMVILTFLVGPDSRIHAANCCFSFSAGVIPPSTMLGRLLLYVQRSETQSIYGRTDYRDFDGARGHNLQVESQVRWHGCVRGQKARKY
jgi:hypothetical protein